MPFFSFEGIKLVGLASCVPTEKVSVESFRDLYGEEAIEKFTSMTGIKSFHRTAPHQTASDLAYAAGEKLLEEKGIDRNEIGALVFIAHSTDYRRPATACVLHKRLGLSPDCAAFDIALGCSAIPYGIETVLSMMRASDMRYGLFLTGETMTKMVHPKDRSSAMMFGDGGAAFLFEKDENADPVSVSLKTDGKGYREIIAPAGGFRNLDASREEFVCADGNIRTLYNIFMNGANVFSFTISDVPKTVKEFFERTGTSPEDYDCFALHQANGYILKQLAKRLKLPEDRVPICLDRYGNTSAPSAAMALCDRYGEETGARKLRVLLCCFGVGLSWGVVSLSVDAKDIYPLFETDEFFEEGYINEPI